MLHKLNNSTGFTLLELLIAVGITGVLAAAGFNFYVTAHNSATTQQEISDMQTTSRTCLDEIAGTLRMAGYKIGGGNPAYRIAADSLYVFLSMTKPVDTVVYFLSPNTVLGPSTPTGWKPMYLMKKVNGAPADVFADVLRAISYTVLDSAAITVAVTAQTTKADESWPQNRGYRAFTSTEQVTIRNLDL